ncbi:MAG TPA: anion transporter [Pirellulales bacterium]|jgi:Na+/H+ antiporter NhaD/arsenite permease-like protein|nr:anion transporter [Pirellulales bacterium]
MFNHGAAPYITTALFALTYIGLAIGKVPGLRLDRAGIALVGAILMLITGMLSLSQAVATDSIDYKTLALLFGMMIVIGSLRLSGFFQRLAATALGHISTPMGLLAATVLLTGVLSAFLINDIVCLTLTPLVLHLARRLRFDPVPHLVALATAANIGSTGTITGNPQNIFIGSHSGISYLRFTERLLPVALIGLVLDFLVIAVVYRRSLRAGMRPAVQGPPENGAVAGKGPAAELLADDELDPDSPTDQRERRWLQRKSVVVTLAAVVLFFTGLPLEMVALGAAAVMLFGRIEPEQVYRKIDWGLLVMFTGLFIVVHAFQVHVVASWGIDGWSWLLRRPVDLLSLVSAGLSNLVSNVPAVLLMQPMMKAVPEAGRETAWLALAMSSTFAGNLTVLGSVANLIVVESARREGLHISFWEYCKVGLPTTVLTLALGIAWLEFVRY